MFGASNTTNRGGLGHNRGGKALGKGSVAAGPYEPWMDYCLPEDFLTRYAEPTKTDADQLD